MTGVGQIHHQLEASRDSQCDRICDKLEFCDNMCDIILRHRHQPQPGAHDCISIKCHTELRKLFCIFCSCAYLDTDTDEQDVLAIDETIGTEELSDSLRDDHDVVTVDETVGEDDDHDDSNLRDEMKETRIISLVSDDNANIKCEPKKKEVILLQGLEESLDL